MTSEDSELPPRQEEIPEIEPRGLRILIEEPQHQDILKRNASIHVHRLP